MKIQSRVTALAILALGLAVSAAPAFAQGAPTKHAAPAVKAHNTHTHHHAAHHHAKPAHKPA